MTHDHVQDKMVTDYRRGEYPLEEKCSTCNGQVWTAEHSPYSGDHDEDGSCNGGCPIQAQCENCQGTGIIKL